jgi:hypothetical protein
MLTSFLDAGGVVVVLAAATGAAGGANGAEALIASGPGLFNVSTFYGDTSRPQIDIVATADPLAAGVPNPFPTTLPPVCLMGSSGGTLVARTAAPGLCPFARHLVR